MVVLSVAGLGLGGGGRVAFGRSGVEGGESEEEAEGETCGDEQGEEAGQAPVRKHGVEERSRRVGNPGKRSGERRRDVVACEGAGEGFGEKECRGEPIVWGECNGGLDDGVEFL